MKTIYNMTDEEKKVFIEEKNKQVEEFHSFILNEIGSRYNIVIREASNSRITNAKFLKNWKLIGVGDISFDAWGIKYFTLKIESVKGMRKTLYDWEKMIKIG